MPYASRREGDLSQDRRRAEQRRIKRRSLMAESIGASCLFCGSTRTGTGGLTAHRKDGKDHRPFHMMGFQEFQDAMGSGDYVRVCYRCHHGVHWAMEFMSMDWKSIEQQFKG